MIALKLIEVGDSAGVVLPDALLIKYGLQEGDTIHLVETPQGPVLTMRAESEDYAATKPDA